LNGVDLKLFFNAKAYPLIEIIGINDPSIRLITMVGRFSEQKDQLTLINSLLSLPHYYHLLLIGEGELKTISYDYVSKINLHSRVHFLGFRTDTERIIKSSFLTCLSSNWEGLSLFSIESMASGIPFIGSNVPGIKDIAENYVPLFEKGNSLELSKLILKFDNDGEYYSSISKKGLLRANEFSLEIMGNKYLNVYNRFISIKKK
jgi:glycosyltransferase involved in cell wall biosynthesis